MHAPLFGGIEGGGTKFVCLVGTNPEDIRARVQFPTIDPEQTMKKAIAFFKEQSVLQGQISAIGIASFGPLDLDPGSPSFGHILETPKPKWSGVDLVSPFKLAFDVPIAIDTDVNGAALGEKHWGAAQGLDTFLYLTIGTGIGGGFFTAGNPLHGLLHPEMGHILLPHDLKEDPFPGACPFHKDCFEGLASGFAMEKRWRKKAELIPNDHQAWILEARYIAKALMNYILTLAPQKIIIGGGVGNKPELMNLVKKLVLDFLNGYTPSKLVIREMEDYIQPPGLGSDAGVFGAIALAEKIFKESKD